MNRQKANSIIAVLLLIVAMFYAAVVLDACGPVSAKPADEQTLKVDKIIKSVACPDKGFCIDGRILRVIDGDTVVVRSEVEYHVRLLDCWAPESRTKDLEQKSKGLKSKSRMNELATGKSVRVFMPENGSLSDMITMGRVLGRIWILTDGKPQSIDLSGMMVNEGLATPVKETP